MTTENGANVGDVQQDVNSTVETDNVSSGESNVAKETTEELLKRIKEREDELKTRDAKIAKLLEAEKKLQEIEQQKQREEFERKTERERLDHVTQELETLKRREALAEQLEGTGVSVAQAEDIIGGNIESLKRILTEREHTAVERLKTDMRKQASDNVPINETETESAFMRGMRTGAGIK